MATERFNPRLIYSRFYRKLPEHNQELADQLTILTDEVLEWVNRQLNFTELYYLVNHYLDQKFNTQSKYYRSSFPGSGSSINLSGQYYRAGWKSGTMSFTYHKGYERVAVSTVVKAWLNQYRWKMLQPLFESFSPEFYRLVSSIEILNGYQIHTNFCKSLTVNYLPQAITIVQAKNNLIVKLPYQKEIVEDFLMRWFHYQQLRTGSVDLMIKRYFLLKEFDLIQLLTDEQDTIELVPAIKMIISQETEKIFNNCL